MRGFAFLVFVTLAAARWLFKGDPSRPPMEDRYIPGIGKVWFADVTPGADSRGIMFEGINLPLVNSSQHHGRRLNRWKTLMNEAGWTVEELASQFVSSHVAESRKRRFA